MAFQQIPGNTAGYISTRVASMNKRALGKLTDANHISQLHSESPAWYDKKIISLYTQTSFYSNDFLQMVDASTPYLIDKVTDYFKWNVCVPFQFTTITEVPDSTLALTNIGINRQPFELIFDKKEFFINDVITADKMYGQQFIVLMDPSPSGRAWRYTLQLVTKNPMTTAVDTQWIQEGREYQFLYNAIGEFDEQFSGLGYLGDKITLFQKMGSGTSVEHKVTDWADTRIANGMDLGKDAEGHTLDLIVYE